MAHNLLAALALAGVVERSGRQQRLRVAPRFLAHAEQTAGRMVSLGVKATEQDVLASALAAWDEYRTDTWQGAQFLASVLAERDQLGQLRPVFPAIEAFAAA
jgi:hypothetical protein